MSSSDFRHITIPSDAKKADRLFRAAVSAFCSLPRPSRREIAQLEDLTLPLFEYVSAESKRYVAAALSECDSAPVALVRRLADESADIAAPLLIRSAALTDVDLIALIGRHGYYHARAIGRRHNLNPAIARLVAVLESKVVQFRPDNEEPGSRRQAIVVSTGQIPDASPSRETAEDVRRKLRAMMRPSSPLIAPGRSAKRTAYDQLRETVLSGHLAFFQTALADALDKDFAAVRDASDDPSYGWLLDALRVLDVADEKAFLITAAIYPAIFTDLKSIRLFLLRFAAISREGALERIEAWRPTDARSGKAGKADYRVAG